MYPSPFKRPLESEFWRSESTNGSYFAPQALTDNFFWILRQKKSQWDFTKYPDFHRSRFFLDIIAPKGPTRPRAEFFWDILRGLQCVDQKLASRPSACPPHAF